MTRAAITAAVAVLLALLGATLALTIDPGWAGGLADTATSGPTRDTARPAPTPRPSPQPEREVAAPAPQPSTDTATPAPTPDPGPAARPTPRPKPATPRTTDTASPGPAGSSAPTAPRAETPDRAQWVTAIDDFFRKSEPQTVRLQHDGAVPDGGVVGTVELPNGGGVLQFELFVEDAATLERLRAERVETVRIVPASVSDVRGHRGKEASAPIVPVDRGDLGSHLTGPNRPLCGSRALAATAEVDTGTGIGRFPTGINWYRFIHPYRVDCPLTTRGGACLGACRFCFDVWDPEKGPMAPIVGSAVLTGTCEASQGGLCSCGKGKISLHSGKSCFDLEYGR